MNKKFKKFLLIIVLLIIAVSISFYIFNSNKNNGLNNQQSTNTDTSNQIKNNQYTDKIPILTFHRIVSNKVKKEEYADNQWVQSVDDFEKMMDYLYVNNYNTISASEFYEWYIGKREYDQKTVMITFDDGFYDEYSYAYPIIKKYNFKATSFLIGITIDKSYKDYYTLEVVNKIKKEYSNFDFQGHSYNMHYTTESGKYRIESMNSKELEEDFVLNKKYGFKFMAYPYGKYNDAVIRVAKEHGYLMAFSFGPYGYATRDSNQYAIPRIKINGQATIDELKKWIEYKK